MNTARTTILSLIVFAFALVSSACTTVNHPTVSSDDLASRLGAPEYADEIQVDSTDTFTNFCTKKECEGEALKYSKTFRTASILLLAIDELEHQTAVATINAEATPFLEATEASIPELRRSVDSMKRRIATLSPARDLEAGAQQEAASQTLAGLNEGLQQAHQKLTRVEHVLADVRGPSEPLLVWAAPDAAQPEGASLAEMWAKVQLIVSEQADANSELDDAQPSKSIVLAILEQTIIRD